MPHSFDFHPGQMQPNRKAKGGEVKIIDQKIWPATNIAVAIVTLKPGGLREMHCIPTKTNGSTT
jgi:oxalate decarboxylase